MSSELLFASGITKADRIVHECNSDGATLKLLKIDTLGLSFSMKVILAIRGSRSLK